MIPSSRMPQPRTLRWLLIFLALLLSMTAQASDAIEKNISLLRSSSDFRVRTQAALALGASASSRAVTPLCQALADDNRTVRIASATALSRLRKGGDGCLSARVKVERDSAVLSALKNALARLGAGAEPAIGPSTKFYVAIQKLAGPERLADPVRKAFVKAGSENPSVAFAPAGESQSTASSVLSKHSGAKGFLLAPRLSRPVYQDGMLQVKMSVAIMSYPGNALIGSYSKTVGMGGIASENTEAENELVVMAAEESMKQFLAIAPTLN